MLQDIQTLEKEVEEKVAQAKHDAATTIQKARTEAATARETLDERLHNEELAAIKQAEETAIAQSEKMTTTAKQALPESNKSTVDSIAATILKSYIA